MNNFEWGKLNLVVSESAEPRRVVQGSNAKYLILQFDYTDESGTPSTAKMAVSEKLSQLIRGALHSFVQNFREGGGGDVGAKPQHTAQVHLEDGRVVHIVTTDNNQVHIACGSAYFAVTAGQAGQIADALRRSIGMVGKQPTTKAQRDCVHCRNNDLYHDVHETQEQIVERGRQMTSMVRRRRGGQ